MSDNIIVMPKEVDDFYESVKKELNRLLEIKINSGTKKRLDKLIN
jgi:hypothetical protein